MFTYRLVGKTDKYFKYEYYAWNKKDDMGYIVISWDGEILDKKLTSEDEGYPMFFNEFKGEIFTQFYEGNLKESGSRCWL